MVYSLDRKELHFSYDQGWLAGYELEITFDKGKRRLGGDFWQRSIKGTLATYTDSVSVQIPSGTETFKIKVIVPEIGTIFETRQKINPERSLSQIRFIIHQRDITKHIYELYDTLRISFNVRNPIDSLIYLITKGHKEIRRKVVYDVAVGLDTIVVALADLKEGKYQHHFLAYGVSDEENVFDFYIRIPFYYSAEKYNEKVEQLRYIAKPDESRRLKKANSPEERKKAYREFWLKRDPTPGTEENELKDEYLARIEYAEDHFNHGDLGWRSDRGRIYVTYGPPDEIDSHPFEAQTRAYEVWFYYGKNLKFIFIDRYGFGRYELLYPEGVRI